MRKKTCTPRGGYLESDDIRNIYMIKLNILRLVTVILLSSFVMVGWCLS